MSSSFSRPIRFALLFVLLSSPALAQDDDYRPASLPGTGVNYETRLSSIEDQMRAMNGQIEQVQYAIRRLDQTLQRIQSDYDARLTKLESAPQVSAQPQIQQTTPVVPQVGTSSTNAASSQDQQEEAAEANGMLGSLKMRGSKVTGAVKDPKASPLPQTPADYGLNVQEQYDRAFSLLRQASYDDAEKAFKGFIEKNPKDKLVDNAKYWYAETFYVRGKFKEAAVAFADAFQQNMQGTKAPDSLLKMGLSLAALDQRNDACSALSSLKAKYPGAAVTIKNRAEQERIRLKCGK